jgi:hypothetical protein
MEIPFEIYGEIFGDMSFNDIYNYCLTSKAGMKMCKSPEFLRYILPLSGVSDSELRDQFIYYVELEKYFTGFNINMKYIPGDTILLKLNYLENLYNKSSGYMWEIKISNPENIPFTPDYTYDESIVTYLQEVIDVGSPEFLADILENITTKTRHPHNITDLNILEDVYDYAPANMANVLMRYYIPGDLLDRTVAGIYQGYNIEHDVRKLIEFFPETAWIIAYYLLKFDDEIPEYLKEHITKTHRYTHSGSIPFYEYLIKKNGGISHSDIDTEISTIRKLITQDHY